VQRRGPQRVAIYLWLALFWDFEAVLSSARELIFNFPLRADSYLNMFNEAEAIHTLVSTEANTVHFCCEECPQVQEEILCCQLSNRCHSSEWRSNDNLLHFAYWTLHSPPKNSIVLEPWIHLVDN
jgi:hypothetical protein